MKATFAGIGFLSLTTLVASAPLSLSARAVAAGTATFTITQYTTEYTTVGAAPTTTTNAAAATTPSPVASAVGTSTPGKLRLNFVNNMKDGPVYGYVTGTDSNNKLVMLTNSGTFYYPTTSSATPEDIPASADVALKLGGHGSSTEFTTPDYISSARLWFSEGKALQFSVTNTGGLVEPSSANDNDPNASTNWGFVELTYTEDGGLYANLSFVDMLGLPLGMEMQASGNVTQSALGPHGAAVAEVCDNLKAQAGRDGHPWHKLCKNDSKGNLIRVVSPQTYIGQDTSAFSSYYENYVEQVYKQFASEPLHVQTQEGSGLVNCSAASGSLSCEGDDQPFTKPSTEDIFGCNSGPFANTGNDIHLAILPRLCAAFNRATLHLPGGNVQPSLPPWHYYSPPANNWYSAFVHKAELDGKGYAFSYDDVTPDEKFDTAGVVAAPNPDLLTIYIGGYAGNRGGKHVV